MLKRIGMILVLALAAALGKAQAGPDQAVSQAFVPGSDADYKEIEALRQRMDLKPSLPQAGADRGEMVLALAEVSAGAAGAGAAGGQGDWKAEDYDALYALLQKYRDELMALGVKQKDLEDMLADLKVKEAALEKRVDNLHPWTA